MLLLFQSYIVYLVFLLGALILSVYWLRRRRKTKLPFDPKVIRFSRTPGEGALKKIEGLQEKIENDLFGSFFAPFAIVLVCSLWVALLKPTGLALEAVGWTAPILCLGFLAFYVHRISRAIIEKGDWRLGHFGERNVADNLASLPPRGWYVFHDVPAENKGRKFNIDHVVVGAGGIFAVETKTPRRHEAKYARLEEHVVEYDGEKLTWPNGFKDYDKLRRTASRANWLLKWMQEQKLPVTEVIPLLAIPWWFVRDVSKGSGYLEVVNPKQLPAVISARDRVLSESQISIIAAKLSQHCRDVEF